MTRTDRILVLGIGNILWADEGFGVRVAEAMHSRFELPDHVSVVDGGTQGLTLLPWIEEADVLLIFDAIDYGLAPGTIQVIDDADVPRYLTAKKMSLHQTSFQEVLGLAALSGRAPRRMRLIGVQPEDLDSYGGSLSAPVAAQIEPALAAGGLFLEECGIALMQRTNGATDAIGPPSVALEPYERGRTQHAAQRRDIEGMNG